MSETESSTPESSGGPKIDLGAEIKSMPGGEKLLGIAAIAALLGFVAIGNWRLFKYMWFPTCAFFGSVLAIVLIALQLFGVRLMGADNRRWALTGAGLLPVVGFVVDILSGSFWRAVMLAGAIVMALAAVRLSGYKKAT